MLKCTYCKEPSSNNYCRDPDCTEGVRDAIDSMKYGEICRDCTRVLIDSYNIPNRDSALCPIHIEKKFGIKVNLNDFKKVDFNTLFEEVN